jgi:hypothetical protein
LAALIAGCKGEATAPAPGTLHIAVSGAPSGATVVVTIQPKGQGTATTVSVPAGGANTTLPPGSYAVSGASFVDPSGDKYAQANGAETANVAVTSGAVSNITVTYAVSSGTLALTATGVDAAIHPVVVLNLQNATDTVTNRQVITLPAVVRGLIAGSAYKIVASAFAADSDDYQPSPATPYSVTPNAGGVPVPVAIGYALASARVRVAISGLPAGATGSVKLTGPKTYTVTQSTLLLHVVPGSYTVVATPMTVLDTVYAAKLSSTSLTIVAGTNVVPITATYARAVGALRLTITGISPPTLANVQVTGPNGFSVTATASQVLGGLLPGGYTVTPYSVPGFDASLVPLSVPVVAVDTAAAVVNYASSLQINLAITGGFVTQSVQRIDRSVSLVGGQGGLLRLIVATNHSTALNAVIRVRFYLNGVLNTVKDVTSPRGITIGGFDEGDLLSTYNVTIPAALMKAGLAIDAEIDPDRKAGEAILSDNRFPASGIPLDLGVIALPPFHVRLIPIVTPDGGMPDVANKDSYLAFARAAMPLGSDVLDVHAPVQSSNSIGSGGLADWSRLLNEISLLHVVEGSDAYDHGVVHDLPGGIYAGLASGSGATAVGSDNVQRDWFFAFLLGENLGRGQSPGCTGGIPDPEYPNLSGNIGITGYDIRSDHLVPPTFFDMMSFCYPHWISEYTFTGMLNQRLARAPAGLPASNRTAPQQSLVIWGRVVGDSMILEPALEVVTRPSPAPAGPYRLTMTSDDRRTLPSVSFDALEAPGAGKGVRLFAFTVPLTDDLRQHLAALSVTSPKGGSAVRARTLAAGAPSRQGAVVLSATGARTNFQWTDTGHSVALVRDAATGEVLAVLRNGQGSIRTGARTVDVTVSDGVRSFTTRLSRAQ